MAKNGAGLFILIIFSVAENSKRRTRTRMSHINKETRLSVGHHQFAEFCTKKQYS